MSYKTEHPSFDNEELFNVIASLDSRFSDVSWHNDEVPSLAITGGHLGYPGDSVLLHVYVDYAQNSKFSDYNQLVSYSIKDADEQIVKEGSCDHSNVDDCIELIKEALMLAAQMPHASQNQPAAPE